MKYLCLVYAEEASLHSLPDSPEDDECQAYADSLAESGHYPAIDIEASISRVMPQVVSEEHLFQARRIRQVYSTYQQNRDLITLGAYTRGTDARVDLAINAEPAINALLQQGMKQVTAYDESLEAMSKLAGGLGKG